jgi:hypothetical protein
MPDARETRFLFGGIDTDSAPHAIDSNALLNAVNIRTVVSHRQESTNIQFIEGNQALPRDIGSPAVPTGTNTLLGKCVDTVTGYGYFFYHNSNGNHFIIRLTTRDGGYYTVWFLNNYVTGGLGFDVNSFISCRASDDMLIWTDNKNPIRYLNTTKTYSSGSPISQEEMSIVTAPGFAPMEVSRGTGGSGVGYTIQRAALQFTYRITNTDGIMSVLAPYSKTLLPMRDSQLASNPSAGNTANMSVPFVVKFPNNWQTIDFVVRFVDSNTFFVIKSFQRSNSSDANQVAQHNAGTTKLSYGSPGWSGGTLEALDAIYSAKQFDTAPITSYALELAGSRLLLGRNKEGYDTPTTKPLISIQRANKTVDIPSAAGPYNAWLIVGRTAGTYENTGMVLWYYAIVTQGVSGQKYYILPEECGGSGAFLIDQGASQPLNGTYGFRDLANLRQQKFVFNVPQYISKAALRASNETAEAALTSYGNPPNQTAANTRHGILQTANGVSPAWQGNDVLSYQLFDINGNPIVFYVQDTPSEYADTVSRMFAPNNTYKVGLQYYDELMRKSGVMDLQDVEIPIYGVSYSPGQHNITPSLSVTVSNVLPNAPPEWAKHYAITLSKNQKANRLINFCPGFIKVAARNSAGEIRFGGRSWLYGQQTNQPGSSNYNFRPNGFDLYGLAIPLTSLPALGYGYEYNEGDFVDIVGLAADGSTNLVISAPVLAVYNSHAIVQANISDLGSLRFIVANGGTRMVFSGFAAIIPTQPDAWRSFTTMVTIYTGTNIDRNLYEVAKFGEVVGPTGNKQLGTFYDTGTLTTVIEGDMYTQSRTSATGGRTCFAITPYERVNAFPVNDTGRVTLPDTIGQRRLDTAIRWSNTRIAGANTNGYGSFEAPNYRLLDTSSGEIFGMVLTTKGIQEGGQIVVVCRSGSYSGLVGKQQIVGGDQNTAFFVDSNDVLGTINPIKGKWGCISPRSLVEFQGNVFWVDVLNRDVIEFTQAGANPISQYKCSRLWRYLLRNPGIDGTQGTDVINPEKISCAVNPYTSELLVLMPPFQNASGKPDLPTTETPDPFNALYYDSRTYIYNWQINKWRGSWECANERVNIDDKVYGMLPQFNPALMLNPSYVFLESGGVAGVYNGIARKAIVAIPFNDKYPATKVPLAVILDTHNSPSEAYAVTDSDLNSQGVAVATIGTTSPYWKKREGDLVANIMRDRLSNNASDETSWALSGVKGVRLKGKVVKVALYWNAPLNVASATLVYNAASGH